MWYKSSALHILHRPVRPERAEHFSRMEAFLLAVLTLTLTLLVNKTACQLEIHFYRNSCPLAEAIVHNVSRQLFAADSTLPAGLLRLQFHDCWTRVSALSSLFQQHSLFPFLCSALRWLHIHIRFSVKTCIYMFTKGINHDLLIKWFQ